MLQIIDDLRNDLRIRDEEYMDQRAYMDKLKTQNEYLKNELRKTQLGKITVESKLSKIVTLRELDSNQTMIENNQFFEHRNSKLSQLNTNLASSVKE